MRITGGRLRGRRLAGRVPAGVRPTSARVREALFSMVGQDLAGWSVLDAFGGTGLLAFEALSRGAGPVVICERRRAAAAAIERSARALGVEVEIRRADAARVLARGTWDLVLLDPPYAEDPAEWARRAVPATRRVLVVEHARAVDLPDRMDGWVLDRTRVHGDSALSLFVPDRAG